jgi:hypothetical protein
MVVMEYFFTLSNKSIRTIALAEGMQYYFTILNVNILKNV